MAEMIPKKPLITMVIVLEEKTDKGQTPLAHIDALVNAREYGDRTAKPGKSPLPTPIVREALKAYSENIDLINKARSIGISADLSFSQIVKSALTTAIRLKTYELKKKGA